MEACLVLCSSVVRANTGGLLRDLRFSGWLQGGNFIESVTGVDATLDFRHVGSSHAHRVERDFQAQFGSISASRNGVGNFFANA